MNQKTTYEVTITNKLQQLPLPDMADAIWQRIESQLDMDMPSDDPAKGGTPKGGGSFPIGTGVLIFVVALVTYFLINKNNQKDQTLAPLPPVPRIETPTETSQPPPAQPDNRSQTITAPQGNSFTPAIPLVFDSVGNRTEPIVNVPLQQDSAAISPPLLQPEQNRTGDQTTKKPKGVPGISDSDYKVVPKKDSSR